MNAGLTVPYSGPMTAATCCGAPPSVRTVLHLNGVKVSTAGHEESAEAGTPVTAGVARAETLRAILWT